MAIVQISRITHRKGLIENLPQLAGGEFGWAVDDRRLFIGNGTLAEGAPVVGNTEILTEYSDLLALSSTYTYKGAAAGYIVQTGTTTNNWIERSLQEKFDDVASVKDFGAVGDGETDDTAAINRALFQLFCRESNEEVRRSLYFPAGVYKISSSIKVPPYAKLWGEGAESTVIKYDPGVPTSDLAVLVTADSLQQISANIGNNGATAPTNIEISSMTFQSEEPIDILRLEKTTQSYFDSVNLKGSLRQADLSDADDDTSAIRIISTPSLETQQVTFDKCYTTGTTYGLYSDYNTKGITFSNGQLNLHYKGVSLGRTPVNGGPSGVRMMHNLFDNISAQGIDIGSANYNVSGFNVFFDVGNNFNGVGNPSSPVIDISNANNLSLGDLFERTDVDDETVKRIELNAVESVAIDSTYGMKMGTYEKTIGFYTTLIDNTSSATTIFTINSNIYAGFQVDYTAKRGDAVRSGQLIATVGYGSNTPTFTEDFSESSATGITFSLTQAAGTVSFKYQTTSTGEDVEYFTYTISKFLR